MHPETTMANEPGRKNDRDHVFNKIRRHAKLSRGRRARALAEVC